MSLHRGAAGNSAPRASAVPVPNHLNQQQRFFGHLRAGPAPALRPQTVNSAGG